MISSYQEALTFLYNNLPMFQRVGAAAIKKDLANTIKLCKILGDPHLSFRSVHVAGTNGKGSTCHMLASIMQCAGYNTGLYTSPHLKEFTERIKVNGRDVSQEFVVDFVNRIRPAIEEIRPSFFEITVAMAFDYFARLKVDVAVIEVGLGGRLDSTNVITPLVSVITNISYDHKDILGDTLPEIAAEKAGIIKKGVPVVVSERQKQVEDVFIAKAGKEDAELCFASDEYSASLDAAGRLVIAADGRRLMEIMPALRGSYQERNVPGVMKAVDVLRRDYDIPAGAVQRGLEDVVLNTGLKGRWQILYNSPTVVCDTGHNEAGITEVIAQLSRQSFDRLFMVLGMVKDKDISQILSLLPVDADYYFCQAKIPRALDAQRLQEEASRHGLRGKVVRDVNEAKRMAMSQAGERDLVFIGGSTYVVAELDEL
jgi:dihydrofolate synthase/folylpolyglutamate synthase